jgi:signal transduction histidine kinase
MNETFAKDVAAIEKIDAVQQILEVICRTTGLGFSAVARVTETHWVACAVRDEIAFGLQPGGELELETTICNEIRDSGQLVVIDHVAEDEAFCSHPTPRMYGFQSYISVPINLTNGQFFGTLCGIDPRPARLNTPATIGMFTLFADLIAMHLDLQERTVASEAALSTERKDAQLREQFIAVLGHDLRNPLGAISTGAEILRTMPQTEDGMTVVSMIRRGANRMSELIDNVLDFARGRLGGGLNLSREFTPDLGPVLAHVIDELQTTWPGRTIQQNFVIDQPVYCDSARLAQMLSNLLANALTHGAPDSPVVVDAQSSDNCFQLSVTNHGETIAPHVLHQLFEPFARGTAQPGQEGLGLGLYICAEIARAHGGTLKVTSAEGETCFTFKMPNKAAQ